MKLRRWEKPSFLINCYIGRALLGQITFIVALLSMIVFIGDAVELFRMAVASGKGGMFLVVKMALAKNYQMVQRLWPVTVALAVANTYSGLSRSGVMATLRSFGASHGQLLCPTVSVLTLVWLLHFWIAAPVNASLMNYYIDQKRQMGLANSTPGIERSGLWLRFPSETKKNAAAGDAMDINIKSFRADKSEARELLIFVLRDGKVAGVIHGENAQINQGWWRVMNASFKSDSQPHWQRIGEVHLAIPVSGPALADLFLKPETLSYGEIRKLVNYTKDLGVDLRHYLVILWRYLLTPLIWLMLAILCYRIAGYNAVRYRQWPRLPSYVAVGLGFISFISLEYGVVLFCFSR